jgi:D-3-phosphoglycerate dehydrogenase
MKARFRIVQTENGSFGPVFDRDALRRLDCRLSRVSVRTEDETLAACGGAHCVLATRGIFTRRVLAGMGECLAIVRFGVGTETVDLDAATELGITVANVPDFCIDEVADTCLASILALNRKTIPMHQSVMAGIWDRRRASPLHRLRGQVAGLVGFGRIARAVSVRLKAFGAGILAFDPYVTEQEFLKAGVAPVELDYLLEKSDYISLHLPLTGSTRHCIDAGSIARMKRGAYIINTSRGAVIDEKALCTALRKGRLAGAALDVLEREPPERSNPLLSCENVILTPHYASYSEEAFEEVAAKVKEAAIAVLQGRFPDSVVNPGVKERARLCALTL